MSAALQPLEFRLAPEFRRCAVYVAVGAVVIFGFVVWTKLAGINPRTWAEIAAFAGVFSAVALILLTMTFRYRIRIDERGVWRRRFVRWDLWPWEAFERGRVRHGRLGDQITFPEKGWYWRTISPSLLGRGNRAAFEAVVGRYWVPPPPPELPDVVTVKYGFRARLEFSAAGIRLMANASDPGELVPWRDVVKAEVFRASHDRPDFVTLNLHLPGRAKPVVLTRQNGHPTWSGADADVIAMFLRRHLDGGRFEVTALRGPPADVAEADRRLARLDEVEQKLRKVDRVMWWFYAAAVGGWVAVVLRPWNLPNPANGQPGDWLLIGAAVASGVVLIGLQMGALFGMAYFQHRDVCRERDELLRWKAEHAAGAPAPAG